MNPHLILLCCLFVASVNSVSVRTEKKALSHSQNNRRFIRHPAQNALHYPHRRVGSSVRNDGFGSHYTRQHTLTLNHPLHNFYKYSFHHSSSREIPQDIKLSSQPQLSVPHEPGLPQPDILEMGNFNTRKPEMSQSRDNVTTTTGIYSHTEMLSYISAQLSNRIYSKKDETAMPTLKFSFSSTHVFVKKVKVFKSPSRRIHPPQSPIKFEVSGDIHAEVWEVVRDNALNSTLLSPTTFLVFRGTLNYDTLIAIANWETCANKQLVSCKLSTSGCGRIHTGFQNAYLLLHEEFLAYFDSVERTPVVFTGHSLGGGLAALSLYALHALNRIQSGTLITFGAPRIGDVEFKEAFPNVKQVRYVTRRVSPLTSLVGLYSIDPVAELPTENEGYVHLNEASFLDVGDGSVGGLGVDLKLHNLKKLYIGSLEAGLRGVEFHEGN